MLKKGSTSVNDYLTEVSEIANQLATTDDITPERDLVLYALGGLGEEYEAFVQNVTTSETEISFVHMQAMLSDNIITR